MEMDSALSVIQNLEKDLQEIKAAARDGKLKPLPGETVSSLNNVPLFRPESLLSYALEPSQMPPCFLLLFLHLSLHPPYLQMEKCTQDLGNSTKAVSSAIAKLLGEIAQGNENYAGVYAGTGLEMGRVIQRWRRGRLWGKRLIEQTPVLCVPRYRSSGCSRWTKVTCPGCTGCSCADIRSCSAGHCT